MKKPNILTSNITIKKKIVSREVILNTHQMSANPLTKLVGHYMFKSHVKTMTLHFIKDTVGHHNISNH